MKTNRFGVVVLVSSLFISSCGGGGGDKTSSVETSPASVASSPHPQVQLHLSGLEEAVVASAVHGRNESLSLTVTALSVDPRGKQKASTVLFTKTVGLNDVMRGGPFYKATEEEANPVTNAAVTVPLPSGVTEIEAKVAGDLSGMVTSEQIDLSPNAEGKAVLFLDVDTVPADLAIYAQESPVNLSLFTPVDLGSPQEGAAATEVGNQRGKPAGVEGRELFVWGINPDDGTLAPMGRIRSGYGGEGSLGEVSEDGGLGFLTQTGV